MTELDHDLELAFETPGNPNLSAWDDPGDEWVACPACNGLGCVYPGARAGHWAGLMPWPDLTPEVCELCGGTGELAPEEAEAYEQIWAEVERLSEIGLDLFRQNSS